MHLDLAADSVNESPNPHIRDLKIKYTYYDDDDDKEEKSSGWTKAYGPELAKILARFQPTALFRNQGSQQAKTHAYEMYAYGSYTPMRWPMEDARL